MTEPVTRHRMQLLTQIVKLLLVMIPDQRSGALREDESHYHVASETGALDATSLPPIDDLLDSIPFA